MSKMIFKMGLGLLAAVGLAWPAVAAMPAMTALHGHVPSIVSQLVSTGRVPATNALHLAIGLPLRNQAGLDALLQQINDPASPSYHHYLTPDQFATQFGPTPADYQAVLEFAKTNGLTVTRTHGNRMLVDVLGKASDVEKSFHVTLRTYHHPKESRDFFAPDTDPTVAASLPVLSVQGLNNYVQPRPMFHLMPASKIKPGIGSAPGGGYMGSDFRNAYVPGTTLTGAGQTVGLLQFDGYYASDIAAYESLAGLPNVPLQNVLLDGFNGVPGANNGEVCLDIETSISMAPGLSKVVVFEGYFPDDILSSMAASNTIKQFSASWGYPTDATTEQLYKQFAVQGQTFLNASGDGDAWIGPIPYGSCEDPNITIVGGTTLTMNGVASSYASETVWNWGFAGDYNWNPDGYAGSSGGISTDVAIPSWQKGVSMATNHGSTIMRNVPDVALTGDNVFVVSSGGLLSVVGGTSCASPLWAGFMALVNQQAAINGKPSVGFLAPAVYALAQTTSYTNYFHDTTAGDNTWDQSLTNFFAVPGYDLATGLGTPNGTALINALASGGSTTGPTISAPLPPWGNTLGVMNGSNPNGDWFLFVQDDQQLNVGIISNGWSVALTTASPVGYAADNQVYATPAGLSTVPGTYWPVTLAVTNYGPSISTNVYVTDSIPVPGSGVTLVSTTPSAGVTVVGNTLTWTVGNLAVNAGASLALNFYVGATALGPYTNNAVVNAATYDPNQDDNSAAAILFVSSASTPPQLAAAFAPATGSLRLSVSGASGQTAIIQASTNLVSWVPVYTNFVPFTFTNLDSTSYRMRFYRAVVGP